MKHSIRHGRTPQQVLEDPTLHAEAKCIYGLMALWVFQGNVCKRGIRYFAQCIGKSPATAYRRIKELIAFGLITQGAVNRGKRSYYILVSPLFAQRQRALDEGEAVTEDLVSYPRRRLATVRKSA